MGKRMLTLYVDDESVELAKKNYVNLSEMFREMLSAKLTNYGDATKEQIIAKQNLQIAELKVEIERLTNELKKVIEDNNINIEELNKKSTKEIENLNKELKKANDYIESRRRIIYSPNR